MKESVQHLDLSFSHVQVFVRGTPLGYSVPLMISTLQKILSNIHRITLDRHGAG